VKTHCTVYKLGGSLLDFPQLRARLTDLLHQQSDSSPLLIIGGGQVADTVRAWDQTFQLGEERSHWLAIRALTFNANLVAELLENAVVVSSHTEAMATWSKGLVPVLDAYAFVTSCEEASDVALPHNWTATSDSVAAWIAINWPADRLVLLKSSENVVATFSQAVEQNMIDKTLQTLAPHLPETYLCNLRAEANLKLVRLGGE